MTRRKADVLILDNFRDMAEALRARRPPEQAQTLPVRWTTTEGDKAERPASVPSDSDGQ